MSTAAKGKKIVAGVDLLTTTSMSTTKARKQTGGHAPVAKRTKNVIAGVVVPQRLHLDKRVPHILAIDAKKDDDELLTTKALALWLQVSEVWVENARLGEYGPPYKILGPRMVRYRRGDVRQYLRERTFTSTAKANQALALIDA